MNSNFIRFFETLFNENWQDGGDDYCMRAVKNMAFVEVQLTTSTVTQTVRDTHYTFAGILSSLGENNFFQDPNNASK